MILKHLLFSLLLAIASKSMAQDSSRLTFMPHNPKAGTPVELSYIPLPSMMGSKNIKGVAYTWENNQWVGHDITVKNEGNVWKGSFTPAQKTGLMAFKFMCDTIVDNGGTNVFASMINKDDGRPWPGGYAAWGLLRSQKYGRSIPGYMDFTKTKEVSDTVVYYWLNNEITYNPSSAVAYAPLFAQAARAAHINGCESRIAKAVAYLKKVGTEEALMNAWYIMYDDTTQAKQIKNSILKKYPRGLMAMKAKWDEKIDYGNPDAVKKHFLDFLADFPYTAAREAYLERFGQSYDNVYTGLMIFNSVEGNDSNQDMYLDKLSFGGCSNVFYKIIDVPHMRKDKTDAQLLPIATKIVQRMEALKGVRPQGMAYLSESEWAAQASQSINGYVAETYSEILRGTGNYDKALEYAKRAQTVAQYRKSTVNDNMAQLLKATGDTAALKSLLEKSVFTNQVSAIQTNMLKGIYTQEHGSDNGFEAYVAKLKNPAEKSAIQKAVEECRRDGIMPEWSLTDASGKTVSSKQLKGKVYVLDFWANWCHPCKASLPGMKAAADHFKDDKDVEFLFIDTQEYTPNYKEKALAYLKEKGLDLHLVFDANPQGSKVNNLLSSQVMKQYTVSGIPMKVVVDAKGNVCFVAIGYKGSPSELKDEMVEMVEQAKKK